MDSAILDWQKAELQYLLRAEDMGGNEKAELIDAAVSNGGKPQNLSWGEFLYNVGMRYFEKRETEFAVRYWYIAAKDYDNVNAMVTLGVFAHDNNLPDKAEKYFRIAAKDGNTEAMHNLGVVLANKGDLNSAMEFFRKAVLKGNTDAMVSLGTVYFNSQEINKAVGYWGLAADGGNAQAQGLIDKFFFKNGQPNHDFMRALLADAAHGDDYAILDLAFFWENAGEPDRALESFADAAVLGNELAKLRLEASNK